MYSACTQLEKNENDTRVIASTGYWPYCIYIVSNRGVGPNHTA